MFWKSEKSGYLKISSKFKHWKINELKQLSSSAKECIPLTLALARAKILGLQKKRKKDSLWWTPTMVSRFDEALEVVSKQTKNTILFSCDLHTCNRMGGSN